MNVKFLSVIHTVCPFFEKLTFFGVIQKFGVFGEVPMEWRSRNTNYQLWRCSKLWLPPKQWAVTARCRAVQQQENRTERDLWKKFPENYFKTSKKFDNEFTRVNSHGQPCWRCWESYLPFLQHSMNLEFFFAMTIVWSRRSVQVFFPTQIDTGKQTFNENYINFMFDTSYRKCVGRSKHLFLKNCFSRLWNQKLTDTWTIGEMWLLLHGVTLRNQRVRFQIFGGS